MSIFIVWSIIAIFSSNVCQGFLCSLADKYNYPFWPVNWLFGDRDSVLLHFFDRIPLLGLGLALILCVTVYYTIGLISEKIFTRFVHKVGI